MKRKEYEQHLGVLRVELARLQAWLRVSGERAVVVFEGRDSAGKGSLIRTINERMSKPNGTRSVISHTCQPLVNAFCLTAVGTTGQG